MLFLFHAGNLGSLVLVKIVKKAANGAYQVWILLKNDAKNQKLSPTFLNK